MPEAAANHVSTPASSLFEKDSTVLCVCVVWRIFSSSTVFVGDDIYSARKNSVAALRVHDTLAPQTQSSCVVTIVEDS